MRLGITRAADELFVSQAAISRQIRELEAALGRPLFERHHRAVALTADGVELLAVLTDSFDRIDASLSAISAREAVQSVTVSVEPTFAALWMVPNLIEFRTLFPDIEVRIESDPRVVEFRANEAVLAIRHSAVNTSWPRTDARRLVDTALTPVLAPSLLATGTAIRKPEDIRQFELLHEENRQAWSDWFQQAGADVVSGDRGPMLADGALVVQSALRGHGVGLAELAFIIDDLKAGRLIQPFETQLAYGAYYLETRSFKALPPPAAALADWIVSKFALPANSA